jgi:hypothetical protein
MSTEPDDIAAAAAVEKPEADAEDASNQKLGYGHRAHQPDPTAHYAFTPGLVRPLPVKPRYRWR